MIDEHYYNDPPPLTVYLIHFDNKYKHAQHYIGITCNLKRRIREHKAGRGNPLLRAVTQAKINWRVIRTWENANYGDEARLKSRHNARLLCPVCNPTGYQKNGG